jgi:uncharacterized membrane protein HdeD (DUF308 family)
MQGVLRFGTGSPAALSGGCAPPPEHPETYVIILGLVLLLLGLLLKISILTTIGIVVLVVGLVLLLLGSTGRKVGGRRHFF